MKLLTDFGHYLGLPAPLELVGDDNDLWQEFVAKPDTNRPLVRRKRARHTFALVQARDLMELARRAESAVLRRQELGPCPKFDFADVYAEKDQRGRDTISKSQRELREWENRLQATGNSCVGRLVSRPTMRNLHRFGDKGFRRCDNGLRCGDVRRHRSSARLSRVPARARPRHLRRSDRARERIAPASDRGAEDREENFRVILDEAQDTEPPQFSVLLETTRPPSDRAIGCKSRTIHRPGHFCMVGDFQQSIYRERADLPYYRAVHEALVADANGESLEFSVTFRLDQKQLDFVNETFREILNEPAGPVRFVELHPRPDILPGKVIRVPLAAESFYPQARN